MQDRHIYEYAVIRVVPRVEREEFVNVGVILFCKRLKFIEVLYTLNEEKIKNLYTDTDTVQIQKNLDSFKRIAAGAKNSGPIALLEIPERFRWLTAVRSSVIQTSRPHPGFCTEPQLTVERLFNDMVL